MHARRWHVSKSYQTLRRKFKNPLLQYQCQRAGSKAKNQNITVTVFWQDRIFIFTYTIIYIDIYTYAFIFGYLNKYGPRFTTIMIVEIWI